MLNELEKGNTPIPNCIIWESTYGFCNKYRCGPLLYYLSLISSNVNLTIDRMIYVLEHDKYIVNAINACDKRYLKEKMHMVETPEADDSTKRIEAHAMVGETKSS